jgi:MurNAc alpha-1-phosphate uridylyltransferase
MKIEKAMVFAAGLGKRMHPITLDIPKPLVKVSGKTLLDYTLDSLDSGGVSEVMVNLHYKPEMIESHLKSRRAPKISLSYEPELLETGGGVAKVLDWFGGKPFFSHNTDIILRDSPGLQKLQDAWRNREMDMLLLLVPKEKAFGYEGTGDFSLSPDGRLMKDPKAGSHPYIFTGIQIISPHIFSSKLPGGPFSLNYFYKKAAGPDGILNRIYGLVHDGEWLHIGTPQAIKEAEKIL